MLATKSGQENKAMDCSNRNNTTNVIDMSCEHPEFYRRPPITTVVRIVGDMALKIS